MLKKEYNNLENENERKRKGTKLIRKDNIISKEEIQ